MGSTATVPWLDSSNLPQVSAPSSDPLASQTAQSILGQALPQTGPTPPQTVLNHAPSPHLPTQWQNSPLMQPTGSVRPAGQTVQDKKLARIQNNVSGIANLVKGAVKTFEDKKQADLTRNIKTVMDAQAMKDSANAIIQNKDKYSPQDVANAQKMLAAQDKILNDKMSDPKIRKQMEKAFDVSFTDPEKNNTPEIKAMQAAHTQFQDSYKAGLNVDSTAEKKVQDLALQGGSKPPDNMTPQTEQHRQITNAGTRGASYSDQFSSQIPVSLGANPAYQAAVKQQETNQKTAAKLAVPIISGEYAGARNAATVAGRSADNDANNKQKAEAARNADITRFQVAKLQAQTAIKKESMALGGAMSRMVTSLKMREGIANKKDQTPGNQQKLLFDNLKLMQDGNDKLVNEISKMEKDKATYITGANGKFDTTDVEEDYNKHINEMKSQMDQNNERIKNTNLRLSNLGYGGPISGGSAGTKPDEDDTTDGNSTGSDDPYDTIP